MSFSAYRLALFALFVTSSAMLSAASSGASDIALPAKRRASVELAERLAAPIVLQPLPEGLVHPFNPVAFGQPDPEELRAIAEAQAAQAADAAASKAAKASGRELLAQITEAISPSGTLMLGGQPYLIFGSKRLKAGDRLTVTHEEQTHTLELVAIDRTTFTLRLGRDEITKRIKSGKNP